MPMQFTIRDLQQERLVLGGNGWHGAGYGPHSDRSLTRKCFAGYPPATRQVCPDC
jgi:hypothetical protein